MHNFFRTRKSLALPDCLSRLPFLCPCHGWSTQKEKELLRKVDCKRAEELQRLRTSTSLFRVCGDVREELLSYRNTSLQF